MMLTSIITVNFNQPVVTIAFLNSIKDKLRQEDIEVILVDNGSAENHENDFKAIYPNLTYIYSEVNLGFA
ncbi:MAG: glycosyltransferase, partial [Pedobacter sp.]